MIIQYDIVVTILNIINNSTSRFTKTFETEVTAQTDALLYNNYHILSKGVYILDMFKDEVDAYCSAMGIESSSIEVDEFEIVALSDRVDVFFETDDDDNSLSLKPTIKCYIHPKYDALSEPKLIGTAYDSNTIIWTWPEDEQYAHYLVEEAINPDDKDSKDKIIAQLPIGTNSYTEAGLEPDTPYTRRLINYTDEQTSQPSAAVTVRTETVKASQSLEDYNVPKNYDFTTKDSEREIIEENLEAFHSGIGDNNDLKVYKQMDADFYQKFKAYFEITGRRFQREKRYEQVGFNYKICLEATEEVEEQEGEVTFQTDVYPREWVAIEDYMWATLPVTVYAKIQATVFLRGEGAAEEKEYSKVYKPKFKDKKITTPDKFIGDPLGIVFILDRTNSLDTTRRASRSQFNHGKMSVPQVLFGRDASPNQKGTLAMIKTVKECIGNIEEIKTTIQKNTGNNVKVKYAIISFGTGATLLTNGFVGVEAANHKLNQIKNGNVHWGDGGTSWGDGIKEANQLINNHPISNDAKYIAYFFSDGFPNLAGGQYRGPNNTDYKYDISGTHSFRGESYSQGFNSTGSASNSIKNDLRERTNNMHRKYEEVAAFICNFKNGKNYTGVIDISASGHGTYYSADYIKDVHRLVASKPEYAYFWNSEKELNTIMKDFVKEYMVKGEEKTIKVFDKWEEDTDAPEYVIKQYDIDSMKAVTVTSKAIPFTFNNDLTPVEYIRGEKRAVIQQESILQPTHMCETNIYDMIIDLVKQTPEWIAGYRPIEAVEATSADDSVQDNTQDNVDDNTEKDVKYLIKGLFIKNAYGISDEDSVSGSIWDEITEDAVNNASWDSPILEDGMVGTVNVFTDVDKVDETTYGDDCYLISKDNYLMVQGYTDAIIYDNNRYARTELNAYDHSTETLISNAYNSTMHNRKIPDKTYGGDGPISHVIDIVQKDTDIYLTGYPELQDVGDWYRLENLTTDLVARIDKYFNSPVLNYRFNLEDPDAKTPLCEILPTCDSNSSFLHVVILHVYYAKNVYISDENNYVSLWPVPEGSPLAHYGDPCMPLVENYYKWTLKEDIDGAGKDNGWYIDDFLWFMAKPMHKTQDYYDELPSKGMESFYGLVNGRYSSSNIDGKKNLIVDTPQFNIPTTVTEHHKDSIRIYIIITEFYPSTALVSYRWEHPFNGNDDITQVNGDYVYFSSDSLVYKDIEYLDVVSTVNMDNQEVFDNKTREKIYQLQKPDTIYDYQNYYLEVHTDNSDVIALKYPTEIAFDENGIAQVGVSFKGVVNATSKWSPRIHNGYYYLNQHEYFAYSEFDVEANFEKYDEEIYKTQVGYLSLDVTLKRIATPKETYSIKKDTRSELLQNEKHFQWVNGKGLTLKPSIDGEYYREYDAYTYTSPVILFEHALTSAGALNVDIEFSDGFNYIPMEIRYYDIDNLQWSEWEHFSNGSIPQHLSSGYQVRFVMQASVDNQDITVEDYMCCYLDWKDDMDENNTTNIVTITDHMTTGPDDGVGIYTSKILDFGCESQLSLDMFQSHYINGITLKIAYASDENLLVLENIRWIDISTHKDSDIFTGRYFRYRIEIPSGEKLYWLHKNLRTKETHEILPYIKSISMTGVYQPPSDVVENFVNTESFEIPKDGEPHVIFNRVLDIIGSDVLEKGYTEQEIESINIKCITNDIRIDYNKGLDSTYPSSAALNSPIKAECDMDLEIISKNTPYIFVEKEDDEHDVIRIIGTPQQYCPIVVEDPDGNTYTELKGNSFVLDEIFNTDDETKYIQVKNNRYDPNNFHVYLDGEEMDVSLYKVINHLVIFNEFIHKEHEIKVSYCILYSFIAKIDRTNNTTVIYLHTGEGIGMPTKCKVYFETGTRNNKFAANDLSLNPIYRTDYKGFIYLTDEHNDPYNINIYANPLRLKAGGYDKIDVSIEVLDIKDNPIISKDIAVDCNYGILSCESYVTDMNGVVHLVYESAYKACTDTLTVKVTKDDGSLIKQSISIINE